MRRGIIPAIFFSCIIYGCSRTLYMPESKDPATQDLLIKGRTLYVDHCSSCHNLHLPNEYSAQEWKKKLDEMQAKAKITDPEKQLIFQYLVSKH